MTPSIAPISLAGTAGQPLRGVRIGGVDVVFGAQAGKYPDGNLVMVRGSDACASFDLPLVSRLLRPEDLQADLVVLSHVHEDHTCGLDLLPLAPVHVHAADLKALQSVEGLARHYGYSEPANGAMCQRAIERFSFRPRRNAEPFRDGATWELGGVRVRAIHSPGHTSGHCVLLIEPAGIAFIADIDLSTFGPYYGDATSNLVDFRETLLRVREIPAACWITSHHKGVITERGLFLRQLDKFESALRRREDAILQSLRQRPKSLEELVRLRFVYPPSFDDIFVDDVERRTIGQHLGELVEQGRVRAEEEVFRV